MNERDDHDLTPAERTTRDAVRALEPPRADDAFRARLRQEFVSGRIGRRRGIAFRPPWFLRGAVWVPVAAAFACVALLAANRGPDWHVIAVDGPGPVVVDGVSFSIGDRTGIDERVRRGGRVTVQGATTLDLAATGVTALALAPGADVTLSAPPNRWWWRGMDAQIKTGDAYFSTGKRFHGAHLDVSTPDVSVRAVGTSFAVLCAPFGTCVCVMEGQVQVGGQGTAPGTGVQVPQGMRHVVHKGEAGETLPILDASVHRLHRQLAMAGSVLGR